MMYADDTSLYCNCQQLYYDTFSYWLYNYFSIVL